MPAKAKGLNDALLAVQKESPALQKDAINPHFKNKYITLQSLMDKILPLLHKHDLLLLQQPASVGPNAEPALTTTIIHVPSGEAEASIMPLMLDKATAQGLGSAITYARRYSLMSILGLVADEDDDGQAASAREVIGRKRTQASSAEDSII